MVSADIWIDLLHYTGYTWSINCSGSTLYFGHAVAKSPVLSRILLLKHSTLTFVISLHQFYSDENTSVWKIDRNE